MNDPRKTRLLTGIIIALVALNIGLLSWFFLRTQHRPHRLGQTRSDTFLADTLGFNNQQRQQLANLQTAYLQTIRPRQRQLRQTRKVYFRLTDSSFTESDRREKAMAFHRQSANVELQTLAHFDRVAALCTPPQRQLLNQLLRHLPDTRRGRQLFRTPDEHDRNRGNGRVHNER